MGNGAPGTLLVLPTCPPKSVLGSRLLTVSGHSQTLGVISIPAVQEMKALGLMASVEELVPWGRLHMGALQWDLRAQWSQHDPLEFQLPSVWGPNETC